RCTRASSTPPTPPPSSARAQKSPRCRSSTSRRISTPSPARMLAPITLRPPSSSAGSPPRPPSASSPSTASVPERPKSEHPRLSPLDARASNPGLRAHFRPDAGAAAEHPVAEGAATRHRPCGADLAGAFAIYRRGRLRALRVFRLPAGAVASPPSAPPPGAFAIHPARGVCPAGALPRGQRSGAGVFLGTSLPAWAPVGARGLVGRLHDVGGRRGAGFRRPPLRRRY